MSTHKEIYHPDIIPLTAPKMEIIFQKDKKSQNKQVESFTLINRLDHRLLWDQNPLLVEQGRS